MYFFLGYEDKDGKYQEDDIHIRNLLFMIHTFFIA